LFSEKKILRYAQNDILCHPERSEGSSYAISEKLVLERLFYEIQPARERWGYHIFYRHCASMRMDNIQTGIAILSAMGKSAGNIHAILVGDIDLLFFMPDRRDDTRC
jgi:hypothetical protein